MICFIQYMGHLVEINFDVLLSLSSSVYHPKVVHKLIHSNMARAPLLALSLWLSMSIILILVYFLYKFEGLLMKVVTSKEG